MAVNAYQPAREKPLLVADAYISTISGNVGEILNGALTHSCKALGQSFTF